MTSRKITIENDHYTKSAVAEKLEDKPKEKSNDSAKGNSSNNNASHKNHLVAAAAVAPTTTATAIEIQSNSSNRNKLDKIEPVKLPLLDQAALRKHDAENRKLDAKNDKESGQTNNLDVKHEVSRFYIYKYIYMLVLYSRCMSVCHLRRCCHCK